MGDAAYPLRMGFNTTLIFWNLSNSFYKPLLLGGGTVANINNGSGTTTIDGPVTLLADSVWSIAGTSLRVNSGITGAGGITKTAGSPLYLEGINTYAGPTLISGGSMVLGAAASISNSPSITLASGTTLDVSAVATASPSGAFELNGAIGQTLAGSGTVVGNVIGGPGTTLIPGPSAGTLTNAGNLTLNGATVVVELGSTTGIGGGINDLIGVGGNLTLAGTITLRVNALAPLDTVNPYTIATYSGTPDFATAAITTVSDSRYTFTVVDPDNHPGRDSRLGECSRHRRRNPDLAGQRGRQRDPVGHQDHGQLVQQSGRGGYVLPGRPGVVRRHGGQHDGESREHGHSRLVDGEQ